MERISVLGTEIRLLENEGNTKFISFSDMAKHFGNPSTLLGNWVRNRSTIDYLFAWEKVHNEKVDHEAVIRLQYNAGTNSFTLSPKKWVEESKAIGIWVKQGRTGGVYAHEDIALEFGMWLSADFKVYLVSEFRRFKLADNQSRGLDWDLKRELSKIYYKVHTDSIQEYLVPPEIQNTGLDRAIYANEADILNKSLFGMTAREWRKNNPEKEGNMRDWATPAQLVMLSMLESQNAFLISKDVNPEDRLVMLNETARKHMKSILSKPKNIEKIVQMGSKKLPPKKNN